MCDVSLLSFEGLQEEFRDAGLQLLRGHDMFALLRERDGEERPEADLSHGFYETRRKV